MPIDVESFKGKFYLLIIDKLVIGAIVALALLAYDQYRTSEVERREDRAAEIQREFERAKLLKEFLPVLLDKTSDVSARAHLLRSAVVTGAINPEDAIELAISLKEDDLEDEQFAKIIQASLPDGLSSVARRGVDLAKKLMELDESLDAVTIRYEPEPPKEVISIIKEAHLWRRILFEFLLEGSKHCNTDIESRAFIQKNLFGLYFLLQVNEYEYTRRLVASPYKIFQLAGHIQGIGSESSEFLSHELISDFKKYENIIYTDFLLDIMRSFNRAYLSSNSLAKLLIDKTYENGKGGDNGYHHHFMRFSSGELLVSLGERASISEPILTGFVNKIYEELKEADSKKEIDTISHKYTSGKLLILVVRVLGNLNTPSSKETLERLLSLGEDKLRGFPFLKPYIERAIESGT
jgi:hypothetical protein